MSVEDWTRLLVIAGYAVVGVAGIIGYTRCRLINHKVATAGAAIIGLSWATFYSWLMWLSPLTPAEIQVASLITRIIHAPIIVSLWLMLLAVREQGRLVESIKEYNGQ